MVVELYKKAKSLTIRACLESSIKNYCKETPKGKGDTISEEEKKNKKKKILWEIYIIQLDLFTCLVIRSFSISFIFSFPLFCFSLFFSFLLYSLTPESLCRRLESILSVSHAFSLSYSDFSHLNVSRSLSATCLFLSLISKHSSLTHTRIHISHSHFLFVYLWHHLFSLRICILYFREKSYFL